MESLERWLISEETGAPFANCVRCAVPLSEAMMPWLVNKDYVAGECVLEYAICQGCRDEVADGFSEESRESVRNFLETEVDWEARCEELALDADPLRRIANCIACGAGREQVGRFAISAMIDAEGRMVMGALPLLMCGDCVGRATAGLSPESRQVWRAFIENHFWGPSDDLGESSLLGAE